MTLFDDNANNNPTATVEHEPTTSNDVPVPAESSAPAEAERQVTVTQTEEKPVSTGAPAEDFAAALETFTTEAEEAVGEDRVIRG